MGVLGGIFLIGVILMVFMFAGFLSFANNVSGKVSRFKQQVAPAKPQRGVLSKKEKLNVILNHLDDLGFFNVGDNEQIFVDVALSQAIGECSKEEGFFWDVCNQGIRLHGNMGGGLHDYWLSYSKNKIGFNWQGSV